MVMGSHCRQARSVLQPVLAALLLLALPVGAATGEYVTIPSGRLSSVLANPGGGDAALAVASFSMRSLPVTVREFMAFAERQPQWQRAMAPSIFVGESYLHQYEAGVSTPALNQQPVTSVSWFAAQAYCESEDARLPSWYEWEYVAAADASHADARGDPKWRASILNWYAQSSAKPQPAVGGARNYYGVRDMHGLIWEWVNDFNAMLVSADSRNQGDPDQLQYCGAGAISLQDKDNFAILMRVALLSSLNGSDSTTNLGFRCAKDLNKETP